MKSAAGKISLIAAVAVFALIIGLTLCLPTVAKAEEKGEAQADTVRYADIYILAGQSNAVGHGTLSQKVKGQKDENYTYRDMIKEDDERNETGYENVYYYGTHDINIAGLTGLNVETLVPQLSVTDVKMGMGGDSSKIGPELGMAKTLSATATEDNPAFIFRYASGGTAIGDHLCKDKDNRGYDNLNYLYGGWASPTITARWEDEKKKDIAESSDFMYKALLTVVKRGIEEVKKLGYEPVLKGYAWMQGESDSEAYKPIRQTSPLADQYERNLTDMINDMRKDVAELFDDEDAVNAPFVIGKISPEYNRENSATVKNNIKIREIQEKVADTLKYCYTVETDDLPLYDPKTGALVGNDIAHFNAGDQYTLGQRFASAVNAGSGKYNFTVTAGEGGTVQRNAVTDGDKVSFKVKPGEDKTVGKVFVNDVQVTDFTVDGDTVTVTLGSGISKYNDIKVEFKQVEPEQPAPAKKLPIWAIIVIVCAAAIAGAAVAVVFIFKKRKAANA